MELRKLEFLLDLAETENYSETAERMFTTQGNVSKQILALEKELGAELIDRSHRKISLTPAAKAILPNVKNLLQEEKKMRAVLEEQSSGLEQLLRIQVLPVFVQYHVPELIARFKAQYPQIRVQIMETEKRQLEQNLEDGKCDVIYTREMVDEEEELLRNRNGKTYDEKLTVAYDRFVAVLPENDPLAERTEISLRELEDRSFLLLDEKTELFSKAQKLCRSAGFEPNVAYQGVRIDTILAMTANGLGVSLLMDQTIPEKKEDGIIKIALKETCESRLLFVRRKSRKGNPAVNVFWEFLKKEICSCSEPGKIS